MKNFKGLRSELIEAKKDIVWSKKINGVPVDIHKHNDKYIVKIDGDTLDSYKTQKEAEMMAKKFVDQYKG